MAGFRLACGEERIYRPAMGGKYVTERLAPDARGIARAVALLREGAPVAVPTETVYGLAARADSDAAIAEIYAAKGRPSTNPLIVHVASPAAAEALAVFSETARALAAQYWPGPLTLVLPARGDGRIAAAVRANLPTIAVRFPAHPTMRAVLEALDVPLAAPSANTSGFISPTNADHVLATLDGRIAAVIDAGPCPGGIESSIVAVREDGTIEELRPGPIAVSTRQSTGVNGEAPGQLPSHYAPGKPVRLEATGAGPDEFLIGFGHHSGQVSLSATGDLAEAAANLYACLHAGARAPQPRIAIAPVPGDGLGAAINDRLRRAATPTPM